MSYLLALQALGVSTYEYTIINGSYSSPSIHRDFLRHLVNMRIFLSHNLHKSVRIVTVYFVASVYKVINPIRRYCTRTKINRVALHNIELKEYANI